MRLLAIAAAALTGGVAISAFSVSQSPQAIVASSITVVDDKGTPRVRMGQDPVDGQRRSRSAGINIYDKTGAERGGMSTFDDGSVVMALDAPEGVGHPMADRIGMRVYPTGASQFLLVDNQTRGVVRLRAGPGDGDAMEGGVELLEWDAASLRTRTLTYQGETRSERARTPSN